MCLKAILESSNNYLLYSYKLRETFRLGYGFVCMSRCMTLTQSTSLIWEKYSVDLIIHVHVNILTKMP